MMRAALIGAVLAFSCGAAPAQGPPEEPQPLACVPPAQARELYFTEKLLPPIRAMRQAALVGGAESIDIQLCHFRGDLVYDVTLLDAEGRVIHRLISATTGGPLGGHPQGAP